MLDLCYECFNPSLTLHAHFETEGKLGDCPTCGTKRTKLLSTDEIEPFFEPFRRLYEVAEHGEHYLYDPETGEHLFLEGADSLDSHLQGDWGIFSEALDHDQICTILEHVCPWWDSSSDYTYRTLWYRHADEIWDALSNRLKHERRFFQKREVNAEDIDVDSQLAVYIDASPKRSLDQPLYRAQKDVNWEMRAPFPREVLLGGRANPAEIAYLYLASDEETALAEVRAEPGERLRIGEFRIEPEVRIIDLRNTERSGIDPFAFEDLKAEINRSGLFRRFAGMLSRPVPDGMRELDYVPTQYLAELIAHKGLDGILFRSSLASGFNLVLFDPRRARPLDSHIVCVTAKKYEYFAE